MNFTVEQLIQRAIRALESGQPSLAVLYMRKARVLVAVDRTMTAFEALHGLAAEASPFPRGRMLDFFEMVIAAFGAVPGQSDAALVGGR